MRKQSFGIVALGAIIAVSGAMSSSVQAYSYTDLVRQVFEDHGSNSSLPLIYRDDNYSLTFQDGQDTYVFGAVVFNSIRAGNNEVPAIKDIATTPSNRQDLPQADAPAVGGLFLARAIGDGVDPEGGPGTYQYFAPAAADTYNFTDEQGDSVSLNWNPNNSNTLLQLFADDSGDFTNNMDSSPQDAIDFMSPSMLAEIGFLGNASVGAQYAALEEYYAVELEFDNGDFVGPKKFVGNLNVLDDFEGLFPGITKHDGGQDLHLWGNIENDPTGGWAVTGDGGRVSFLVPSPVAVGPGLALLGMIGLLRKPRQARKLTC